MDVPRRRPAPVAACALCFVLAGPAAAPPAGAEAKPEKPVEHVISLPDMPLPTPGRPLYVCCLVPVKARLHLRYTTSAVARASYDLVAVAEPGVWTVWPVQPRDEDYPGGAPLGTLSNRIEVLDEAAPAPVGGVFFVTSGPRPTTAQLQRFSQTAFLPNPSKTPASTPGIFRYWLDTNADVAASVVPRRGGRGAVRVLTRRDQPRGVNELTWDLRTRDGKYVPTGFYEARFRCRSRDLRGPVYAFAIYLQVKEGP